MSPARDLGEDVLAVLGGTQPRWRAPAPTARTCSSGRSRSASCVEVGEVEQARGSGRPAVARRRAPSLQPLEHARRGRAVDDLEPDDVAEAAAAQLDLDRLEQVVGLVGDLEVGVAGDAERRRARRSPSPGTAAAGSARSPPRAGPTARRWPTGRNRGSTSGTFTRANRSSPPSRVADEHAQAEREPGDVGEGLARADRERRQDREDLALEASPTARRSSSSVQLLDGRRRRSRRRPAPGAARALQSFDWRAISSSTRSRISASVPARCGRRASGRRVPAPPARAGRPRGP